MRLFKRFKTFLKEDCFLLKVGKVGGVSFHRCILYLAQNSIEKNFQSMKKKTLWTQNNKRVLCDFLKGLKH